MSDRTQFMELFILFIHIFCNFCKAFESDKRESGLHRDRGNRTGQDGCISRSNYFLFDEKIKMRPDYRKYAPYWRTYGLPKAIIWRSEGAAKGDYRLADARTGGADCDGRALLGTRHPAERFDRARLRRRVHGRSGRPAGAGVYHSGGHNRQTIGFYTA